MSFVEAGESIDFPKLCSAFARTGCCAQTFINVARVVSFLMSCCPGAFWT